MDLRTGKIRDLNEIDENDLKHFIEIQLKEMTERQKEMKQVSLKDHKSKLGKKLTKARNEKGYAQMTKNQKRNLRKKLK